MPWVGIFIFIRSTVESCPGCRCWDTVVCPVVMQESGIPGGPSFHIDSKVERLNIHQGNVKDMKVAMTYETGKLDVMATVENEQMQGGVLLAYDLSDSLNFLSTRGQLRIDELAAFGFGYKRGTGGARNFVRDHSCRAGK